MPLTDQQKQAYFERIQVPFKEDIQPTVETLKALVEGHMFNFPYETLNVHDAYFDGRKEARSNLDFDALFEKMVHNGRGGRCAELNIFMQAMLKEFGFDVMPIAGELIYRREQVPVGGRPKHTIAIVTINQQEFLVDVGMESLGMLSPVSLEVGKEQPQYSENFRIHSSKDYNYEFQNFLGGKWVSLYGFSKTKVDEKVYHAIDATNNDPLNPKGFFQHLFMCTKPVKRANKQSARYKIVNDLFTIYEKGKATHTEKIVTHARFEEILEQYFGIDLKGHHIRFKPIEMHGYSSKMPQPVLHRYSTRTKVKWDKLHEDLKAKGEKVELAYREPTRKGVLRAR